MAFAGRPILSRCMHPTMVAGSNRRDSLQQTEGSPRIPRVSGGRPGSPEIRGVYFPLGSNIVQFWSGVGAEQYTVRRTEQSGGSEAQHRGVR